MADLPNSFWGGWIAVITVTGLVWLLWMLYSVYFTADKHDSTNDVVWDETLTEGAHPAPLWWFWLILALLIISATYLMLYPGLGSYAGVLKWSHGHRLEEVYTEYKANYATVRQEVLDSSPASLQANEAAMRAARGIFASHCASCHGQDGQGMALAFPNLNDDEWQWGNTPAQIEKTLRQGRVANMPAWGTILNETAITEVVAYLRSSSKGGVIPDTDPGKRTFQQYCIACHGSDGKGNVLMGAPDLMNEMWLHGGDDAALTNTITHGSNGIMPAFHGRLNEVQIHLLIAWLSR